MGVSGRNVCNCAPRCQRYEGQCVAHFARLVAHVRRASYAQLAVDVFAPTLHGAVVQNGTSVFMSSGDGNRCSTGSKVNAGQVVTHLARMVTHLRGVTDAQLTETVDSPTFYRPVVKHCTRESFS